MLADHVGDDADKRRPYKCIDEAEATGFVGKGNYGQVYIAEDTLTGGVVAVKRQKSRAWQIGRGDSVVQPELPSQ